MRDLEKEKRLISATSEATRGPKGSERRNEITDNVQCPFGTADRFDSPDVWLTTLRSFQSPLRLSLSLSIQKVQLFGDPCYIYRSAFTPSSLHRSNNNTYTVRVDRYQHNRISVCRRHGTVVSTETGSWRHHVNWVASLRPELKLWWNTDKYVRSCTSLGLL